MLNMAALLVLLIAMAKEQLGETQGNTG